MLSQKRKYSVKSIDSAKGLSQSIDKCIPCRTLPLILVDKKLVRTVSFAQAGFSSWQRFGWILQERVLLLTITCQCLLRWNASAEICVMKYLTSDTCLSCDCISSESAF